MFIQYDMTLQYYFNVPKIRMQCVSMIQEYVSQLLLISRIRLTIKMMYQILERSMKRIQLQNPFNIPFCFRVFINYFNLTICNYDLVYRFKKSVSIQWQGRVKLIGFLY